MHEHLPLQFVKLLNKKQAVRTMAYEGGGGDDEAQPLLTSSSSRTSGRHDHRRRPSSVVWLQQQHQQPPGSRSRKQGLRGHHIARWMARWCFPSSPSSSSSSVDAGMVDEAWAYFETVVLPRRIPSSNSSSNNNSNKSNKRYELAPPGTPGSELYPVCGTQDLSDFGTGLAVYFDTLRALAAICFVAGLLYLPSIYCYSTSYRSFRGTASLLATAPALAGSMVCTDTEWVPCPTCNATDYEPHRIALSSNERSDGLIFVLRNACAPLRFAEGINQLVVMLFLMASVTALGLYQRRLELKYDEDILTASDFSIVVQNPPDDAMDPEEWKEFFSQFGEVVYCTVALDNQDLVKALVRRRVLLQQVMFQMPRGDENYANAPLQTVPESLLKSRLAKMIDQINTQCRKLLTDQTYSASDVFVTFETEQAQRAALKALSVGGVTLLKNRVSDLPSNHVFRERFVLNVVEAKEPSVTRWKDLRTPLSVQILERIVTYSITAILIAVSWRLVKIAFQIDVTVAAYLISALNTGVPMILTYVNRLESHSAEGAYQAALYFKVSVFRFINTAIVTEIIKPFTSTTSPDEDALIPAIHAILLAEITFTPIYNLCDPVSTAKRFLLGPLLSKNQADMNSYFRGTEQSLGEKYTNMTKIIFLCFFYCAIFPASFFFGSVAIVATYYTDKFLLLRSWSPLPELGDDTARLSRRVFFPFALLVLSAMSVFYWSSAPFDHVCATDSVVNEAPEYIGTHSVEAKNANEAFEITVSSNETVYRYCKQDYLQRPDLHLFDFLDVSRSEKWMTPAEATMSWVLAYSCLFIGAIVISVLIIRVALPSLRRIFGGRYETFERDSGERFSSQHRIKAYVPQVPDPSFRFPLIACDLSGIDPKNIGWIDPLRSQSYYSLDQDVQFLMKQEHNVSTEPKLSIVKHWPGAVQDESETAANAQANDLVRRYGGLRQGPSPSVEEDHEKV